MTKSGLCHCCLDPRKTISLPVQCLFNLVAYHSVIYYCTNMLGVVLLK